MVELIIGILGIIVIAMGYVIWNLSHKNKIYEDELGDIDEVISAVSEDIKNAYDRLVSIDRLGSFQADDPPRSAPAGRTGDSPGLRSSELAA